MLQNQIIPVKKNPKQTQNNPLFKSVSSQTSPFTLSSYITQYKLKKIQLLICDYIYRIYGEFGDHPIIRVEDIARYLHCHEKTVRRHLKEMRATGVITVEEVYEDNLRLPNRYVLSDEYLEYRLLSGRQAQEIRPLKERKPYTYQASMQKGYNGQRISCVRFVMENVQANIYKEDNYRKKEETKKEERYAFGSYAMFPASQCPQETWREPSEKEICEKTGMDMTSFSQFLLDCDADLDRCANQALQAASRLGFKKSGVSLAARNEAPQEDGCLSLSPLCISTSDSVELRVSDADVYQESLRCPGKIFGAKEIEAIQREYRRLKVLQFNQEGN